MSHYRLKVVLAAGYASTESIGHNRGMSDSTAGVTITELSGGRMPRRQRRAQLLAAARGVFVAAGYHAAAMDDIAEQAGISKPVLYQHFPSKLELYLALLEEQAAELVDRVRGAMTSTTDNRLRVHNAMAAYFDYVDADGEAFRLIFESDLRNQPEVAKQVEQTARTCMSAIADLISTDTGFSRERAELLAIGVTGAAELAARYWLSNNRSIPKEEAVELLVGFVWRGIAHFPMDEIHREHRHSPMSELSPDGKRRLTTRPPFGVNPTVLRGI